MVLDLTGKVRRRESLPECLGQYSDFYTGETISKEPGLPNVIGIKVIRGGRVQDKDFMDEFNKKIMNGLNLWVKFNHVNIARCYGYASDCGLMSALIMDYYPDGSITEFLKAEQRPFKQRVELIRGIAEGLKYLHGRNVIHGDLRAANVFVDHEKRAKIADYELVYIINTQEFTSYKPAGAARWIAPELTTDADDEEYGGPKYTMASDVFAFAMTIIEVFTGDVPFASKRQDSAVLRIISEGKRPEIPEEILKCGWLSIVETMLGTRSARKTDHRKDCTCADHQYSTQNKLAYQYMAFFRLLLINLPNGHTCYHVVHPCHK